MVKRQAAPPPTTASASPGPRTGLPGRPGVAPRPGEALPGQGGKGAAPPRAARRRIDRARAPAGRQRTVPADDPRRAPRPWPPAGRAPCRPTGPRPRAGGRPGDRVRIHEDKAAAKKDREKELLLDKERQRKKKGETVAAAPARTLETIEIPDLLTVQELATSMIVPARDVIAELIKIGHDGDDQSEHSRATSPSQIAKRFGFNAVVKEAGEEVTVEQEEDKPEMLTSRPPVVTVLGHVDHGKTSLLDKIRQANVAAGEAGGITQKIGAYTVERNDRKITFIDTPGHEAFTAMRARGAKVTDVAILVVAADDGVMPQTKEAIAHVKAANVPIVVAINKMDKADAQPDRVKQQLAEQGLQPVDWGGTIEMVPVSAKTGDGIDDLLETVLLEADMRELKANKNRRASGVVIESALASRARRGRDRARAERHAARRRHRRRGRHLRQSARAHRRQGQAGQEGRPVDPGRDHGPLRRSVGRRHAERRLRRARRARDRGEACDAPARRAHGRVGDAARLARDVHVDAGRGAARRSTSSSRPTGKVRSKRCARAWSRSRTTKSRSA